MASDREDLLKLGVLRLQKLSAAIHEQGTKLEHKRRRKSRRDTAACALLVRMKSLLDVYIYAAETARPQPAFVLLRSMFETVLLGSWCLSNRDRAQLYFDAGRGEACRNAKRVLKHIENSNATEEIKMETAQLAQELHLLKSQIPGPKKLAHEAGLDDVYDVIWGALSASTHGNFFGSVSAEHENLISPEGDPTSVLGVNGLAEVFVIGMLNLHGSWLTKRELWDLSPMREYVMKV